MSAAKFLFPTEVIHTIESARKHDISCLYFNIIQRKVFFCVQPWKQKHMNNINKISAEQSLLHINSNDTW